jgi:flagellar biogenesis protein FliO
MFRTRTLLSFLILIGSFSAQAGVKVTSLDLYTHGQTGFVKIALDGRSSELPDLKVVGNSIELILSDAEAFNAISKSIRGAQLSANVLNGKVIVKALLPYELERKNVDLSWKNSSIEIIFPRGKANIVTAPIKVEESKAPAQASVKTEATPKKTSKTVDMASVTKKPSAITKEALNEDYLNNLMNETKTPEPSKNDLAAASELNKDEVNLKQSAPAKVPASALTSKKEEFSFAGYAAKFTVFLALVLGIFYGIVQIMKKGLFNKGKMGFLNNHQMIEILSTTYVSPKKCLMVVKAHKQLFLVANSENGLQFLSEMKDTSGLIKEGEKIVTGTNFDSNLESLNSSEAAPSFTLKEDITKSTPIQEESGLSRIAKAKDIVKFSDELKKKAKKLKPIEFN